MSLTRDSRWGLVTVFDAKVYNCLFEEDSYNYSKLKEKTSGDPLVVLNTLKVSNITAEGPSLTITGGQNDDVLLKRGKKYRMEIQDALGRFNALEAFGMGKYDDSEGFVVNTEFGNALTIIGEGYVINNGIEEKVEFIVPKFIPDSIVNINLSASGDAAVFDLNGDIVSVKNEDSTKPNVFYVIRPMSANEYYKVTFVTDDNEVVGYGTVKKGEVPTPPEGYSLSAATPVDKNCIVEVTKQA